MVKLTDYEPRWAELERDRNPFAVMVMAHLRTRATKHDPTARLDSKMALVRALYERGYERQQILELFRFIDWLLHLPDELEQRFHEQLQAYEATMSTPYITSIERRGIEQGERQAYVRQARLRFGAEVADRLAAIMADVHQTEQLVQIGEWVVQCTSGSDLLDRVESLRTQH